MNVAVAPTVTVCVRRLGRHDRSDPFTVSVAALLVAEPAELVNTARYSLPFSASVVLATVSVPDVAPRDRVVNVVPPSVETCHCTVGVGVPDAAAVNVAVAPTVTV